MGNFTFRGNLSTQEVDDNMEKLNSKNADDFVEWIPNNLKSGLITTAPKTSDISATFVANTTALKGIFQRLATQFGAMYRKKLSCIGTRVKAWTRWNSKKQTRT